MAQFEGNPEFSKLLAGRVEVDLVQLMLELACDAYPSLDRVGCLLEIDRLGVACCDHAGDRRDARGRLLAISQFLYEFEGFHGNREAYYEPQNSYLNEVLARRRGIPISLGILYMAVSARTGLKTFGVSAPGHFVVGCASGGETWFVDPFSGGDVLDAQSCRTRIEQTVGKKGCVDDHPFRAASPLEIVARVLRNLKAAHAMQSRWCDVLCVQRRLAALLPEVSGEQRDLGLVFLRVGQPTKALPLLEGYACSCDSQQQASLKCSIQTARRMIAEMN